MIASSKTTIDPAYRYVGTYFDDHSTAKTNQVHPRQLIVGSLLVEMGVVTIHPNDQSCDMVPLGPLMSSLHAIDARNRV